ncbi:hypothetical protein CHAB381_1240 [Campylobacter hominis ATCC BAA-381]|uniref:Uncharacterized protein n=1 Tax=Campylobacter hominis (strain ATCC BAA-381 / DSM 21671 / CCUG 45161 / LMG 19568 / NCTC 13146 / CH001A) TaxID=360107 RepID=A7I2Q0_CAMHC|nr:hypothetical protein CHAB381_1240 [Campylobacter hominis ATCC BAA-381]
MQILKSHSYILKFKVIKNDCYTKNQIDKLFKAEEDTFLKNSKNSKFYKFYAL